MYRDPKKEIRYSALGTDEKVLFNMRRQLVKRLGVIYRQWRNDDETDRLQLLYPEPIHAVIFGLAHEVKTGGHLPAWKMLHKINRRYFWPEMKEDVQQMILSCESCATKGSSRAKKGKMQKYRVGRPMERTAMDILGPLNKTRGNNYILLVGDYFTKWIEAYPIPNQEANRVYSPVRSTNGDPH